MKRVVLDTNIFVSMALGGQVGKINDEWREGKFILIVSEVIVSEYFGSLTKTETPFEIPYNRSEFVQQPEKFALK